MGFDQSKAGISSLVGVLLLLSTTSIGLRLVARIKQKNAFGWDDWLMIPAWLCLIGLTVDAIWGMCNHFYTYPIPIDKAIFANIVSNFAQIMYVANMFSILALGFIRLSALFFYRRIFLTRNWEPIGIVTFLLIIIVILWTLGWILLQTFSCRTHFKALYGEEVYNQCVVNPFIESVAISSFILDVLVLITPIPNIWKLHATTTRKLIITIVFLLAAAGVAASCARMVINIESINGRNAGVQQDLFLFNTKLLYYMILEVGLGQIAVNLPSLWYLRGNIAPEHILRSIRSLMSLRSSNHSLKSSRKNSMDGEKNDSTVKTTQEYEVKVKDGKQAVAREARAEESVWIMISPVPTTRMH